MGRIVGSVPVSRVLCSRGDASHSPNVGKVSLTPVTLSTLLEGQRPVARAGLMAEVPPVMPRANADILAWSGSRGRDPAERWFRPP
jgi:hypothetical protein